MAVVTGEWLEIYHIPEFIPFDQEADPRSFDRPPPQDFLRRAPVSHEYPQSSPLDQPSPTLDPPYIPLWYGAELHILMPASGKTHVIPCIQRPREDDAYKYNPAQATLIGSYRGLRLRSYPRSNASTFTYYFAKETGQWVAIERRFDMQESWSEAAFLTVGQLDEQSGRYVARNQRPSGWTNEPPDGASSVFIVDFA